MTGKLKPMSPDEVLQLAKAAEERSAPGITPDGLLGFFDPEDAPEPAPPAEEKPTPPEPKMYCDSCGHVGSHGQGCPELDRLEALQQLEQLDAEEQEEQRAQATKPEPIIPLVRRIGASLLHRVAKRVAPKD